VTDPSIVSAYRNAFARRAVPVVVERIIGFGASQTVIAATVPGVVQGNTVSTSASARTDYAATEPGAISQGDREVLLLADDLEREAFPLPLAKNDRITLPGSSERLSISRLDPHTRALAGAIICIVTGVT